MIRDIQNQTTKVASRHANGSLVRAMTQRTPALSDDLSTVAFVGDPVVMGDGNIGVQVYVAPTP
jgi:hypothetical protein